MYKTTVIRQVAKRTRLSQHIVSDVVSAMHRLIEESLRGGESVTFPGFGTFYQSKRKGGQVKHVRTGKMIKYPGRAVAAFKAGDILKRAVAGKRRTLLRSLLMGKIAQKPQK
jgi:DNA-binding protein HU-beta